MVNTQYATRPSGYYSLIKILFRYIVRFFALQYILKKLFQWIVLEID